MLKKQYFGNKERIEQNVTASQILTNTFKNPMPKPKQRKLQPQKDTPPFLPHFRNFVTLSIPRSRDSITREFHLAREITRVANSVVTDPFFTRPRLLFSLFFFLLASSRPLGTCVENFRDSRDVTARDGIAKLSRATLFRAPSHSDAFRVASQPIAKYRKSIRSNGERC